MHLLQLAGGQAWPNLLPILALRPKLVTYLTSSDPTEHYRRSIEAIRDACRDLGVTFEQRVLSASRKEPTTEDCREILKELTPDCINLTGGTKPMSLAAYDLALAKSLASFYLDTRRRSTPAEAVHPLGNSVTEQINQAFPRIIASLNVPVALRANGFPVPPYFKTAPEPWMRFAVRAADIRSDFEADREIGRALASLRQQFMGQGSSMPRKGQLRQVLQTPISALIDSPWHQYLCAAHQEGIIQLTENSGGDHVEFLLLPDDPFTTPAEELRSRASETFKLLEGVWFELAVLHHLKQKSSFGDIAWSVEADHIQDPTASSRGETDLVAFNTVGLALHFISCKTTGPHSSPLDAIQGLRNRATKEGGQFSKAELWIFRPKSDDHRNDLANHCREQNVALRVFTETQSGS